MKYQVNDLFYTQWKQLASRQLVQVAILTKQYEELYNASDRRLSDTTDVRQGLLIIQILRLLRRNPRLVDKIDEAQAVDIFNSLSFLWEPWYHFPKLGARMRLAGYKKPDDQMARCSFDQWIYADKEFTSYLIYGKPEYLNRLVATLYLVESDTTFDKETVDDRSVHVEKYVMPWKRELIMMTFANVKAAVMSRCKTLLPKPVKVDGDQQKAVPSGAMWYQLKHELAKSLVFGTFDELGASNMYSVLDHLEMLSKQKKPQNA